MRGLHIQHENDAWSNQVDPLCRRMSPSTAVFAVVFVSCVLAPLDSERWWCFSLLFEHRVGSPCGERRDLDLHSKTCLCQHNARDFRCDMGATVLFDCRCSERREGDRVRLLVSRILVHSSRNFRIFLPTGVGADIAVWHWTNRRGGWRIIDRWRAPEAVAASR